MDNIYAGKRILITGAAGTIGSALVKKLLLSGVNEVRSIDNNESQLFFLNETFSHDMRHKGFYADIRDLERLKSLVKDIDIIIHTAAMKHVIISELSPMDAVKTNVEGTANVISAAMESPTVNRVIYTSSDKAVNPTNVMGITKLLAEKLITSAHKLKGSKPIIFSSTRFGNVIGSNGSVVPIFYSQIIEGKDLTITDARMTRFFMTIGQATDLVMESSALAKGGEVFITKMPAMRVIDLAAALVGIVAPKVGRLIEDIELDFTGAKPGEKIFEELMSAEEITRAYELKDLFMVKPAMLEEATHLEEYETILTKSVDRPYVSTTEPHMNVDEIKRYIMSNNIIEQLEITNFSAPFCSEKIKPFNKVKIFSE